MGNSGRTLKIIELFAGIGSQTQALKNIGVVHEVVAISEIDKYVLKSYEALHGIPNNLGDIREIKALPKADLWTYSFPCTDISLAGRMAGIREGTRSGLLLQVERLLRIAAKQGALPKYLLLENVKNLVGKKFKADFDNWLSFLSSFGYENYWQVLNAKHYGIPQNRERVFCVSIRGRHTPYMFPERQELKLRLRDLIDAVVEEKYYLSDRAIAGVLHSQFRQRQNRVQNGEICSTLCARDFKEPYCVPIGELRGKKWDKMHDMSRRVYGTEGLAPTVHCAGGGNTEVKIAEDFVIGGLQKHQTPRMDGISPTLTEAMGMGGGQTPIIMTAANPNVKNVEEIDNEENSETKVIEDFYHSRPPRVFDTAVPALLAGRSGLKVVSGQFQPIDRRYKAKGSPRAEHFECRKDDVSNAVLTGDKKNCIQIAAMRGRMPETNGTDKHFEQRLEVNREGVSNTLTGVQKDNLLIEQDVSHCVRVGGHGSLDRHSWDIVRVKPAGALAVNVATKKGYDIAQAGDYVNVSYPNCKTKRGRVGKSVAQTVTCGENSAVVTDSIRIRKLTPRECLRLMGWADAQIDKIQAAGVSATQQYKQAGNGIVVQVLEAIFRNLFLNRKSEDNENE